MRIPYIRSALFVRGAIFPHCTLVHAASHSCSRDETRKTERLVRGTNATGTWKMVPSLSSKRYVHNSRKSQLYTYLGSAGHLVLPSSVRVQRGLYTIVGNPSYVLIGLRKHAFTFPLIVILGKSSPTMTKAGLRVFTYCDSAHNSKKNQPYTYLTRQQAFAFSRTAYCDSYAT